MYRSTALEARKALQETVDGLEISVKFRDDTVVLSKSDFVTKDVLELTLPKLLLCRRKKCHSHRF